MPTRAPHLVVALLLVAGCPMAEPPPGADDPSLDGDDEAFLIGKADGACVPDATSPEARGVLTIANAPDLDAAALRGLGLHRRTAAAVVAARPIADLADLDAVPTVGPRACARLRRHACEIAGRCEPALSVWTWNVEHFPLTAGTLDAVAQALLDQGADLVGFQEVDDEAAFDELIARLPGWAGIAGATGFDTRVAIAFRTDRLRALATEDLYPDDDYRFPRPPLAVTFALDGRVGATTFTVVDVHLKAMTDAASTQRRRAAVLRLEEWLAARAGTGDARTIVLGDWNDEVDDGAGNVFAPLLDRPGRYAAWTLPLAQAGAVSYLPFRRLIDHQFATTAAATTLAPLAVDVVPLEATISGYQARVSDHLPVRARLEPILPAP